MGAESHLHEVLIAVSLLILLGLGVTALFLGGRSERDSNADREN